MSTALPVTQLQRRLTQTSNCDRQTPTLDYFPPARKLGSNPSFGRVYLIRRLLEVYLDYRQFEVLVNHQPSPG